MRNFASVVADTISRLLMSPRKVLVTCLVFALAGILLDGTLYQMWELGVEKKSMQQKISETEISIKKLQKQIRMAHDPRFIEREARDRFDLVNKDDIVFVFSNDE
ncbi:MAG: septum formation initiator family protein [Bdellovibrionota bacterium]